MTSYAVIWRENDGPLFAGRLEVSEEQLRLDGTSRHGQSSRQTIPLEELGDVGVGRAPDDRLAGRASIKLERRQGGRLRLGSIDGRGALVELVDLLTGREGR